MTADWLARFDREIAEGKIGSAMITATRGTRTAPALIRWTPRFLLAPLLDMAARRSAAQPGGDGTPESQSMSPRRRPVLWVLLWQYDGLPRAGPLQVLVRTAKLCP